MAEYDNYDPVENAYDDYYDSGDDYETESVESEREEDDYFDPLFDGCTRPRVRWTEVRIGTTILEVSSEGQIKPYNAQFRLGESLTTLGTQLQGTPFRVYTIENRNYFVHDIIFQAFYGQIPPGYAVRHLPAYVSARPRRVYSNRISCLTLCPLNVSPLVLNTSI
jgi:hypothetical protein